MKKTRGEFGSEVEIGLDSDPVTPLILGLRFLIHPSMWSKERFSMTKTTTVFIGVEAVEDREMRKMNTRVVGVTGSNIFYGEREICW